MQFFTFLGEKYYKGLLTAILDAILDLTAFRYSDFARFLVCYSPPQTVPETVKEPFLAIFRRFNPILWYIYPTIMSINYMLLYH